MPPLPFIKLSAALSVFVVAISSVAAHSDPIIQFTGGAWADDHSNSDSNTRYPFSVELDDRGRLGDTPLRYGALILAGSHDYFQDNKAVAVRELFIHVEFESDDLKLGRLLLPWGRADQINPTDSLVTRDYQWRTTTDEQQKSGNDGLMWTRTRGDWKVSTVWLPYLESSRLPWIRELRHLDDPSIGSRKNVAFRVDKTGQGFDAGGSIYQGADLMPSLGADVTSTIDLYWENYRIRRIGFDGAVNLGRSTLRTELANTSVLTDRTDSSSQLYGVPSDEWQWVMGVDRDITDGLNINLQLLGQWLESTPSISNLAPALQPIVRTQQLLNQQPEKELYGMTWRIQQLAWQDTLTLEISGIAYGDHQGGLWRPRIAYKIDDATTIIVGADRYYGNEESLFGLLKANETYFVKIEYSL